jgi:ribosomal protein S18 acetylase RimI-like enzyme
LVSSSTDRHSVLFAMQIRILGRQDGSAFQTLRLQALQECPSAFASSYEEEYETPISVVAERLAPAADHCVFGALEGTELIGTAGLAREGHLKLAHKAFIWGVYVAPRFRQQGVGRQLLAQALAHAATMPGLRQVNLGVNLANIAAISLYESLGFTSFGVERGFLLVDGQLHDEMHMVRVLTRDRLE